MRSTVLRVAALLVLLSGVAALAQPGPPVKGQPGAPGVLPVPAVADGNPARAEEYYKSLATDLGFANPDTFSTVHTLQDLLTFGGYEKLLATDIEKLDSSVVMSFDTLKSQVSNAAEFAAHFGANPAADDGVRTIQSVRYFTPKITDVAASNPPAPARLHGWRHVVRLEPRKASPASVKEITEIYILFNHFGTQTENPFAKQSINNQAIVVRKPGVNKDRPLYFLVYEPLTAVGLGKVKLYLDASFDASSAPSVKRYHVPDACVECHGALPGDEANPGFNFPRAKLNYLDSDHWFDRIQNRDDFPDMQYGPHGVLFDGGKDLRAKTFETAFDTLRRMNQRIADQNEVVEANLNPSFRPSFQLLAVKKWLQIHATDPLPKSLVERALDKGNGAKVWKADNPNDVRLLAKLNQYCFRCHSSLRFSAFDKQAVFDHAGVIPFYVGSGFMPQDRVLEAASKDELLKLIAKLASEP